MIALITTNARLLKTPDGKYWSSFVYGYDFFTRYLNIFDQVKLVAHCKKCSYEDSKNMLRVDGDNLFVYEVPFPNGKTGYIKMYNRIRLALKASYQDCDIAILRIPDQLAFQLYPYLKRHKIPVGVEVTSDSWDLFAPSSGKGKLRPLIRLIWFLHQKYICNTTSCISYVTKAALQQRYKPLLAQRGSGFTTSYTDTFICDDNICKPRNYNVEQKREFTLIHVAGSIAGYVKGHKELIDALGILKERGFLVNLVIVGAGRLNSDVLSLIDKYELEDNIRFTNLLTDQRLLHKELMDADMFVFPSYREGLPRVIVEAMACALPCIATELPGIKELLDEECLVPIKASLELADKIEFYIKNPLLLNELSKNNVTKVREYSQDKMVKKMNEFYNEIKLKALTK